MTSELENLLIEHSKSPKNYGKPDSEHRTVRRENPLCGDWVEVHQRADTGELSFTGQGCVISQAVASLVLDLRAFYKSTDLVDQCYQILSGKGESTIPELAPLMDIAKFPLRRRCCALVVDCLAELKPDPI